MHTLYICYFGLREPLVQTQVLPYLREIGRDGVRVSLLTFEPDSRRRWPLEELETVRAALAREGVEWHHLSYHKRPSVPATLYDILAGAWFAARLARREHLDVLHARAHVPLAMALLACTSASIIFDLRGLMAEEYADAGIWSEESLPFRAVKLLERAGLSRAGRIVVLTRRMRDWLVRKKLARAEDIEVIPCCVDLSRYSGEGKNAEADQRFEVVYAGSVSGLYMLEEMAHFFAELRAHEPRAFLRVLSTSPSNEASLILRRAGLGVNDFSVGSAPASEVPGVLQRARLGLSFRKPTFSQAAASPTKIPEYLAAGLPVVSNSGIGDTDELLEGERVGVLVREFSRQEYGRAAIEALSLAGEPGITERCKEAARRHFDLVTVGGARYRDIYRLLGERLDPTTGRTGRNARSGHGFDSSL